MPWHLRPIWRRRCSHGENSHPSRSKLNIHYLQHVPYEDPGGIADWARARGHALSGTHVYKEALAATPDAVDWLVVMGGPMDIYNEAEHPWLAAEKRFIKAAIEADRPVLGICLGAQLIAHCLGARVHLNACREIGWYPVDLTDAGGDSGVFAGLPPVINAFHWHSDTFDTPPGAVHAARSQACDNQAFVYNERVVGLQFHLETTPRGAELLIEHCGTPGSPEALDMMAEPARFAAMQAPLWRLLDNLSSRG